MALSDFSNVTVSGQGAALTRVGFGTLLIAGYHTAWTERTRSYTGVDGLVTDGIPATHPIYLAVERAFQQNPRPSTVKVGRLALPATKTVRITPIAVNSATYAFTIQLQGENPVDISITADSSTSVDEICDAIQAALEDLDDVGEALEGLTVTAVGGATATALDLTVAAGVEFWLSDWDPERLKIEDRTADPGIATDLAAIRTADSDWYGLAIVHTGKAIAEEAADWAETQDVIHGVATSDWLALDSGQTTDIQSVLAAKSYARTICYFDHDAQDGFAHVAGLAERLVWDPGLPPAAGGTFHAKTLRGVTADALTPTQKENLRDKGYTVYISTAGVAHTLGGESASGEFLDYTRFVDWFRIRLQERLAQLIISNQRIPYDARGISAVESVCRAQLQEGLASGGISPVDEDGNEPTVTVPTLAETSDADRAERVLNGVRIQFKYAGAIHRVNTTITVTL